MADSKKPNVLCFIMDQLRHDHLGCMGNEIVQTPNIDSLASRGVVFERAYVANPLCMPARSTLFTGRTPRDHGVRTNGIPLIKNIPTLPEALRQAGYRTHAVGKLHLTPFDLPNGASVDSVDPNAYPEAREMWNSGRIRSLPTPYYGLESVDFIGGHVNYVFGDYLNWLRKTEPSAEKGLHPEAALEQLDADQCYKMSLPEELHYSRWIADRAIDFLSDTAQQNRPFFLWCSFPDPHHPYASPRPWCDMYDPRDIPLPKNRREGELEDLPPFYRKIYEKGAPLVSGLAGPARLRDDQLQLIIAQTYGMMSLVDFQIGRILRSLQNLGLAENTLVILLSDHGDMMGDHWMIRKGPFHFEGLLRIPFICSWPGRIPQGVRNSSIVGQIDFAPTILDFCGVPIPEGEVPCIPEALLMRPPWPGKSLRKVMEGKEEKAREAIIVENDEDYLGLKVRTMINDRYKITIYPGHDFGEIFDLKNDPSELHNLWHSVSGELKKELLQEFIEEYLQEETALPRRMCHA